MRRLAVAHSTVKCAQADVQVMEWSPGDPFPQMGASVGVDTETELITDTVLFPKLVALGVFDAEHSTCWIAGWEAAPEFMRQLCARDIQQRYFNLGFDEGVLGNEDIGRPLVEAIQQGRVRDMQVRVHMNEIATIGYIRGSSYSLAGCSKVYLDTELDKGDGTEDSARLSFRRGVPLTDEQAVYLAFDCIATWALGEIVPEQPEDPVSGMSVEVGHTKGMCVLAHMSANGFGVDPRVHQALDSMLHRDKDAYRLQLMEFGFPDPYRDDEAEAQRTRDKFSRELGRFLGREDTAYPLPSKGNIRLMLVQLWNHSDEPAELKDMRDDVESAYWQTNTAMRAGVRKFWDSMKEEFGIEAFDCRKKKTVMPAYIAYVLETLNRQGTGAGGRLKAIGYNVREAFGWAAEQMDSRPDLMLDAKPVGPRKFFLDHVIGLLKANVPGGAEAADAELARRKAAAEAVWNGTGAPTWTEAAELQALMEMSELKLDTTPESGDPKLTLKDMWRLEDLGITDRFLDAYTRFRHCEKYLSTYLDPKYVKEDGKVHPHYTGLVRTGRTASTNPNIQNLPSRDKNYPLKLMYRPPEGAVLCSTDFSFVELCGFGQNCYTKYKDYEEKDRNGKVTFTLKDVEGSVMRKVINAGLDPHRWFAGVMTKVIEPDLSRADDPEWVAETKAFLKEKVPDSARQLAKMANFGLPGGLSEDSFYVHCREGGLKITQEDAKRMRDAWLRTFKEMNVHMNRQEQVQVFSYNASQLAIPSGGSGQAASDEDAGDSERPDRSGRLYTGRCVNGMVRGRASRNSAANMAFQALVAYGAKLAGWNLLYHGYGDRLLAFIHDEYLYWLWPGELEENIPRIESLMLEGMGIAIPDVKVGCETTCCLHWDKKAEEFAKLKKDENGHYVIEEPEFIKEVYNGKRDIEG